MLCKDFTIPNFNPKKDNFFKMLHFTCTFINFFTKSIQIIHAYSVFVKEVLKGDKMLSKILLCNVRGK